MIYIEEHSFEEQILILKLLCKIEKLEIIMWLFPESNQKVFCDIDIAPKDLLEGEPITTYDDGFQAKKTKRIKATKSLFDKVQNEKKLIMENCDSLALYRPQTEQWLACTIGHEYMILINDDSLIDTIISQDFNASLKKPDWW